MSRKRLTVVGFALLAAGCTAPTPKPVVTPAAPPVVQAPPPAEVPEVVPQFVALIEPYLVEAEPEKIYIQPPTLGGRIRMIEPAPETAPLIAPVPSEIRPVPVPVEPKKNSPPAKVPETKLAPAPKTLSPSAIATIVRLLDEERARSVETAKRRLAAATTRASQTEKEAKTTADLVRSGALAQVKSDQAAAAAKEAAAEQAEAQKALDEAQQRQRDAKRDVEAALKGVAENAPGMALIASKIKVPAFQPVSYTYRLSILGSSLPGPIKVEQGTLGRTMPTASGEAGAWIVRCVDPSRLKVTVGDQTAKLIVRRLPSAVPEKPRV